MLTLILNGEVYAPEALGVQAVLLVGDQVGFVGAVDPQAIAALPLPCNVIDARGCIVVPGLIDPHEHLIGAGGEQGWASRTAEIDLRAIVQAGITTVVGCLGTDTTTRQLSSLLAKARQLTAEGITAYCYTGGFSIPPQTVTGAITDDLVLIDQFIGAGEIAIADERSSEPSVEALAHLVSQALVGGSISGKAGVTHVHVGAGRRWLAILRALLDQHDIPVSAVYPTHITRSAALMDEAIELAQRGAYVDIDTVEDDLPRWLRYYIDHDGPLHRLTVSSDAQTPGGAPAKLYRNFVAATKESSLRFADIVPLFTTNPADALRLAHKGRLTPGADADVLALRRDSLEIVHVIARGQQMIADGRLIEPGAKEQ